MNTSFGDVNMETIAKVSIIQHPGAMTMKFDGSLDDLKNELLSLDLQGEWQEQPDGVWKLMCKDRSGLLWSATNGVLWFDGPPSAKAVLASKVEVALSEPRVSATTQAARSTIFVVHGTDQEPRDQLELILRRLGLQPCIMWVSGGGEDTVIGCLEGMVEKNAKTHFGIVLATPDDQGHAKGEDMHEARPRATQNVVLEMGMLLASLSRNRCAILQKGYVELPSNLGDVLKIPYNKNIEEVKPKLVEKLQEAGFKLDTNAPN